MPFSEKCVCMSVNLPRFAWLFLENWFKHIKNKNQSSRSSFVALKNCIMLNVSLTKTEQNTFESSMKCSSKLSQNKQNK